MNATLARTSARVTIQDNERPRAPIDLSLAGRFFADATAAGTDYLHLANPYETVALPASVARR